MLPQEKTSLQFNRSPQKNEEAMFHLKKMNGKTCLFTGRTKANHNTKRHTNINACMDNTCFKNIQFHGMLSLYALAVAE